MVKGRDEFGFQSMVGGIGDTIRFERGETIYQPGNESKFVYIVEEGRVRVDYLDESGKKLTLFILGPGEMFGEMCLVGEKYRRHMATAIEEAVIRRVDRKTFPEMLKEDPSYFDLLLEHFARRMREFEEALENLAFRDISARMARMLLKLSGEYGVETEEGIVIGFHITHKDLADMIGAARENVTNALNRFVSENILGKRGYRIVIRDEEGLREKCHVPVAGKNGE
jgi:CRP-like cAMP-binding protein